MVIDVAVSRSQETGAPVTGELALSGTCAKTEVHPVRLSKLQGRTGPVFEDVVASVEEVRFAFPGFSSVFRRERRCLRPGLVPNGG